MRERVEGPAQKMSTTLVHELIHRAATRTPAATAVSQGATSLDYAELSRAVGAFSTALVEEGLEAGDRVAVFMSKRPEALVAFFGATGAGGVAVPVNPILKAPQVRQIFHDCRPRFLVTCEQRLARIAYLLAEAPFIAGVYVVDSRHLPHPAAPAAPYREWPAATAAPGPPPVAISPEDRAALLYTSGSTGMPKGVILSHLNMALGAESVSTFLGHRPEDRLLVLLPLSFDAGLSQVTSALHSGCAVELMDYLVPGDVVRKVSEASISGITAVPPVWIPLAGQEWPEASRTSLRYVASTGGRMPPHTVSGLRNALPSTDVVLMYGFTEAFRSSWLDPRELDARPGSVGKPIPHAEVLVVRPDGARCEPDEVGELVHRGALVSQGYWNDAERTAERFRPVSNRPEDAVPTVWSGDLVRRDAEGYLYFVERRDEMIKTSGYRVSPTEVEAVVYETGLVDEVLAIGLPDESLGQSIGLLLTRGGGDAFDHDALLRACRALMPTYMVPRLVLACAELPKGAHGKPDRRAAQALLLAELAARGGESHG